MKRICAWTMCVVLAGLLMGCATGRTRLPPMTQADVISLVKAGEPDELIIRRIDASGTVFNLSADDVVLLRKEGVSDRVVTHMMETKVRAAAEEERRRSYYEGRWHYGIGVGRVWY
ncbi:MAG: hypothetical protein RMM51_07670 [Verrucomicrobiae bacterium]|nr:hypothetical protein [Verrucomicrobiae bacterium]